VKVKQRKGQPGQTKKQTQPFRAQVDLPVAEYAQIDDPFKKRVPKGFDSS